MLRAIEVLLWTSAIVIAPIRIAIWPEPRPLIDFDAFHTVGSMILRGDVVSAYDAQLLLSEMEAISNSSSFMPWTYPPQFDLIVALLAMFPYVVAIGLFGAANLAVYLPAMKGTAREESWRILAAMFPAAVLCITSGQNGLLVAGLAAFFCLGLERNHWSAGIALGLMSIKPHLAVAFAVYLVATGRWGVMLSAAATIVLTSALATLLLGIDVWVAFFSAMAEAKTFLSMGLYPLYRMVSLYATAFTLGAPASVGFVLQGLQAVGALVVVGVVARSGFSVRQSLGITAVAGLMISPYAYDYDLPLAGVGLALLASDIRRLASTVESLVIYIAVAIAGGYGIIGFLYLRETHGSEVLPGDYPLAIGALCLLVVLVILLRVLFRDRHQQAR